MIRKFLKYFLIPLFILGFLILIPKDKVYAKCGWENTSTSDCASNLGGAFPDLCCHTTSGCSSSCGNISWYDWCHDTGCQVFVCYDESYCEVPFWWIGTKCAHEIAWIWSRENCSAVDTCSGDIYLRAGICASSGCAKGGNYKICCSGSTPVRCNLYYQQDGRDPPEGTCAPNTYVMGGSCPCNCTSWTLGSCGASSCGENIILFM